VAKEDNTEKLKSGALLIVAAALGSTPSTFISSEMYMKLSRQSTIHETELLQRARWIIKADKLHDRHIQEIADLRIKLAKAGID